MGVHLRWSRMRWPREGGTPAKIKTLLVLLVWLAGLASTLYLIGLAFLLVFYAVIFGTGPNFVLLHYLAFVAESAVPAIFFGTIGIAGLLLWPSARLWPFGLLGILVETMLAAYT